MSTQHGLPPPNHPVSGKQAPDRRWYDWARRVDKVLSVAGVDVSSVLESIKAISLKLGSPDGSIDKIPTLDQKQQKIVGSDGVAVMQNEAANFVQVSLDALPDAGGGILQKFVRDDKGRVAGTSAATTSDLPEGGNLYYTNARADSRVAIGISDHVAAPDPHTQYILSNELSGYISGLRMRWVSGTSIAISSGAAHIQSTGGVLVIPSEITVSGLSLSASSWYHVYLYNSAGGPAIEIVSTQPASPYFGTARAKSGDTTRRYIGSVLTNSSGAIWCFKHDGDDILYSWGGTGTPPQRILSGGIATTATSVSLSVAIPITANAAIVRCINLDTAIGARISHSGVPGSIGASGPGTTNYTYAVAPNSIPVCKTALDESQSLLYWFFSSPTGSLSIDVFGYSYSR